VSRWLYELYGPEAQCVQVSTIQSAVALLQEEPKDLLLIDLSLVQGGDWAPVHTLIEEGPHVPTVVMTGEATDAHAIAAIKLGAEEYIPKLALTRERLAQGISYALARHERVTRWFQRLDELRLRLQEALVESRA
jgi:DNA-binding NarL/FixJ family response regulator